MKVLLQSVDTYQSEALQIASIAKGIRKDIFEHDKFKFSGHLPPNCQSDCIPYNLKLLISMIMFGPTLRSEESINSQACLTISQLVLFNVKKKSHTDQKYHRHSLDREPPLPIYLGLNIHSQARSKKMIDQLNELCICISYDRVIQLEKNMALSMCQRFQDDNAVCPSHLRKGIFVAGALDNIDHNPSSTTAQSSFHGTGISIIQFPTKDNMGICREPLSLGREIAMKEPLLPQSYTTVPAVALNAASTSVPERECQSFNGDTLCRAKLREESWLKKVMDLLETELEKKQPISWAAYHANLQPPMLDPPAITALLPLFCEHADTPAMIKHGMEIIKQVTEFLNPGQIPVMACDCPIFAKAKYIQWTWPTQCGEDKFIVMFGGLHIEMAMWNMLGDYLASSGWTIALLDAGIASSGTADSFLKASHLARTRHAHQVTIAALTQLQHQAFTLSGGLESLETWRAGMIKQSPTFQFWDTVLRLELFILVLVRAHREKHFNLYIEALESLTGFFFALDHYNYARWIPIHIRDMKSLPTADFKQHWVVSKTTNRFSSMPLDQSHEQENAKVKGKGGVIGLTESPTALQRWLICGPEIANCLSEFENQKTTHGTPAIDLHHEEGFAAQCKMQQQVKSLVDVISAFGNPFEDDGPELLVLNSRDCMHEAVIETVRSIEALGKSQYQKYVANVIDNRTVSIHDSIKKNSLPLFRSPKPKIKSKTAQQLTAQRSNASLFGRLYIANQQRDGDLATFFCHENQSTPPSLSDFGISETFVLGKSQLFLAAWILAISLILQIILTVKYWMARLLSIFCPHLLQKHLQSMHIKSFYHFFFSNFTPQAGLIAFGIATSLVASRT